MYLLKISNAEKSNRMLTYDDSEQWWKNFVAYCLLNQAGSALKYIETYGGVYRWDPVWCIEFEAEDDATAFKLKFS